MSRLICSHALGFLVVAASVCAIPGTSAALGAMDADMAWPLCGRITQAPPAGWFEADGCPADRLGNADHSDFPLDSTYGPRLLQGRYDFHRGIDIATPTGTPVFSITDGIVRKISQNDGETKIKIRHYRPGFWGECTDGGGCYHSIYLHMSEAIVEQGDVVAKGQLIGYTGASSATDFEHLHLEIADAPHWDPYSAWNRDAIHPLSVLPYHRELAATSVAITAVDASDPLAPVVSVTTLQTSADKTWDIARVEVEIIDTSSNTRVAQPGEIQIDGGYHINPPYLDMVQRSFQYSHKDSSKFPWSFFEQDCPLPHHHGSDYSSNYHVDRHTDDDTVGDFNGMRVTIPSYNDSDEDYTLTVHFDELVGTRSPDHLCVRARAITATGEITPFASWNCEALTLADER